MINWQALGRQGVPGSRRRLPDAIYVASQRRDARAPRSGDRPAVWRINTHAKLSAGVGADDTLVAVGTDKGEVLAFDPDGKPEWTAQCVDRSRRAAARVRRRRRGAHRRRQHPRPQRRGRRPQVGEPAQRARTHGSQLRGRRRHARRPVRGHRRWQACSRSTLHTGMRRLGRDRRQSEGRDRARAHRRRDRSLPMVDGKAGLRRGVPGPRRVLRHRARHARSGRATCRASTASPATARMSTSPTTRARCRRSTAAPARRYGSRTAWPERRIGGPQVVGEFVGGGRRRGLRAPAVAEQRRLRRPHCATDGTRADRRSRSSAVRCRA